MDVPGPRATNPVDIMTSNGVNLGFEEKPCQAADRPRNNMDAAEHRHVVLGLIFLKHICNAFRERHKQPLAEVNERAKTLKIRRVQG